MDSLKSKFNRKSRWLVTSLILLVLVCFCFMCLIFSIATTPKENPNLSETITPEVQTQDGTEDNEEGLTESNVEDQESEISEPVHEDPVLITKAEVISWNQLTTEEKSKITICSHIGNTWNNMVSFDCKQAYFIKAEINNEILAERTSEQYANHYSTDYITKDYVLKGYEQSGAEVSDESKCSWSYGKYKNKFIVEGENIFETDKFGGYDLYSCIRKANTDTIIIGAFKSTPSAFSITANSKDIGVFNF